MSLKQRISGAARATLKRETLKVPEWDNAELEIVGMSLGQRSWIMDNAYRTEGKESRPVYEKLYPALLIFCVRDPKDKEPVWRVGDEKEINAFDPDVVQRVADICLRVSGLSKEADTELGKDSGVAPSAALSSSSPES